MAMWPFFGSCSSFGKGMGLKAFDYKLLMRSSVTKNTGVQPM